MNWPEIATRYPMPKGGLDFAPWWSYGGSYGTNPKTRQFEPGAYYRRKDHVSLWVANTDNAGEVLAAYDRENPLPVPGPACGQVWRLDNGTEIMVGVYNPEEKHWMGPSGPPWDVWPPHSAVLIAGPGAPWADTRPR